MPTHPTAPDPSSDELKTRIANFMRRAEDVVNHPLASPTPGITLKFTLDPETNTATSATMDHNNIPVEGLVFLATRMRPYIFLKDDPISLEKLTGQIEREHPGFRGKFKPFRKGFLEWCKTPIVATMTMGEVPPELQTDTLQILAVASAPVGTPLPNGIQVTELTSDMYYAELYFNAEHWHSDDDKAAEYEAASDHEKSFIAKCAELRTIYAIPFVRSLHEWVVKVREMGMDI